MAFVHKKAWSKDLRGLKAMIQFLIEFGISAVVTLVLWVGAFALADWLGL